MVGSLHHPAYLAPQRLALPVSGDDAVHLAGGLHGEDEMVARQMAAGHLVHAVGHTRGQGIAHQIAVACPLGRILAEDEAQRPFLLRLTAQQDELKALQKQFRRDAHV